MAWSAPVPLTRAPCHNGRMGRLFLRLLINAIALWLTTLILSPHLAVKPFSPGGVLETIGHPTTTLEELFLRSYDASDAAPRDHAAGFHPGRPSLLDGLDR